MHREWAVTLLEGNAQPEPPAGEGWDLRGAASRREGGYRLFWQRDTREPAPSARPTPIAPYDSYALTEDGAIVVDVAGSAPSSPALLYEKDPQ